MKKLLALWILFMAFSWNILGQEEVQPHPKWSFQEAGLIPFQNGGRIKPLDAFARETVLFLTGKRTFEGWHPVDLLFSFVSFPKYWNDQKFILVDRSDVRQQLLLDAKRRYYSPAELLGNSAVLQYGQVQSDPGASAPRPGEPKQNPRDSELRSVFSRILLFQNIVSGQALTVVPTADKWGGLIPEKDDANPIFVHFAGMLNAYHEGQQSDFERSSVLARGAVEGAIDGWTETDRGRIVAESWYYRIRPFLISAILFLLSGVLWLLTLLRGKKNSGKGAFVALSVGILGLLFQVGGFALRMYVSGRPPVSNMYESLVWVAFGTCVFGLVLYFVYKNGVVLAASGFVAGFILLASDAAPAVMDPSLHPLVPVLRSNFWLTIHVLTITLGYSAFALSLGISDATLFKYLRSGKPDGGAVNRFNQMAYGAMKFGVVLLAAGTILGGVWADYSWGRFWGWDPKETWALIALLAYLAILHGRYAGWVGQFGFAAWSVICFLTVVMAWYGVNFVLGAGLHSYGWGAGGLPWVAAGCALQLAFVLAAFGRYWTTKAPSKTKTKKKSR